MKCIRRYVQKGSLILSFWFWCDVNRSTFDEDMRENDFFYIFDPSDL